MRGVEKLEQRHMLAAASLAFEATSPKLEVADINVETIGLAPRDLTVAGDLLFFTADDGIHGRELWKTDATAEGTALVQDIIIGQEGAFFTAPVSFVTTAVLNDTLFFIAGDQQGNVELWKSDGTSEGTTLVKQLPARPREMLEVNHKLFLSIGSSLWASDGTENGTLLLTDVGLRPEYLTEAGTTLFFSTFTSLWKSDGTLSGTQLVKDVAAEQLA
jgi:ELWxxDGT repeat protein